MARRSSDLTCHLTDSNKAIELAEKAAEKELKNMGVLEMADEQAEALIKGLLRDAVPDDYKFDIKRV